MFSEKAGELFRRHVTAQETQLSLTNRATRLEVSEGHQTIRYVRYGFLLDGNKTRRFWDIRLRKMSWPWNPGQRLLKVIGTDTHRSVTYDFLLTSHSNHGPISTVSEINGDFGQYSHFFHPHVGLLCVPA